MNKLLAVFVFLFSVSFLKAQDTTWVQTFSFDDITKRRGEFVMPKKDDYRKILMYYTLKCDPKTTQDRFNCGEWDYLTYNFLYDHNATFDSTFQQGVNYKVGGVTPDTFNYTTIPVYDYHNHHYEFVKYLDTISYATAGIGAGTDTLSTFIANESRSGVSQVVWTANELLAAGLNPGEISGFKFYVVKGGIVGALSVGIKGIIADTITWQTRSDDYEVVFEKPMSLQLGWQSIQFNKPFVWNGVDNISIQVETRNTTGGDPILVLGSSTSNNSAISHMSNQKYLDLIGGGGYANLGKDVQVDGSTKRTVEMWAYTKEFNSAGLFQGGRTGSSLNDWSLRTMSADDSWRIQLWGADGDATLTGSKENWHHYAMVYDGSATILYYDGEFVRQKSAELNTPDADLWIGRWSGSYFNGHVDNIRVWEGAVNNKNLKEWMNKDVDTLHPNYDKLKAVYKFDNDTSVFVGNDLGGNYKGVLIGNSWRSELKAIDDYRSGNQTNQRPNIIFEQGKFNSNKEVVDVKEKVLRKPELLFKYNNTANGTIIKDNAKKHPSLITDTVVIWQGNIYSYTYDAKTGLKIDSSFVQNTEIIYKEQKEWYSPTVKYEIGRYITPYGINLSLGKEGFTWVYDVTDYAPLLFDTIDLAAGNQQELIDLKFAFISGTPIHEVKRIDKVWNHGSYSYRNLDNDVSLKPKSVSLLNDAETFIVRSRLTGHGHNSNDGEFPHCCEWKDNTHYLYVDGKQVADWHIWREDCDLNPVYPQGGNWVGAREGWCPGDVVSDFDFNITKKVSGSSVELDYDLTPVPSDNQGMGGGNYIIAMQLFQYGATSFNNDASIEMVKRPTDWDYHQRINPACAEPIITVKNTGKNEITKLKIAFGVSGGQQQTFEWEGKIAFLESVDIALPIDGSYFWVGDEQNLFTATIEGVNGGSDDNSENNSYTTHFELPEILKKQSFFIQLKTNNVPEQNNYVIKDAVGKVVYTKDNLTANTLYRDTIDLPYGCYTFEFFDEGYGLSYWAWPDQGNGSLQMRYVNGGVIKNFEPDFGEKIYWPFAVGTVSTILEGEYRPKMSVYPNPSNGQFQVELNHITAKYTLDVYDVSGRVLKHFEGSGTGLNAHQIDLQNVKGVFIVKVTQGDEIMTQRVVLK